MQVRAIFLGLLYPALISADFDCETNDFQSEICGTELKCIYDGAYEGPKIFCKCKITVNAVSFPNNVFNNELFNKVCQYNRNNIKELEINDAGIERIDEGVLEKLASVNLAGNKMELNFSQMKLNELMQLDVSRNELKSCSLNNLQSLKKLNFSHNQLNKIDSRFSSLLNLEELYLNNNLLNVIRPADLNHLQSLRVLNLASNFLVLIDGNFQLNKLEILLLNNNKLTSIKREDFKNLPQLQVLDLGRNLINRIGSEQSIYNNFAFQTPTFLKNLRNPFASSLLQDNQHKLFASKDNQQNFKFYFFTNPMVNNLNNDSSMQQSFRVSEDGESWGKLQDLNLAENGLGDIPESFLTNLGELRRLNVSHNELQNFDFNQLERCYKLIVLDVRNNRLMDKDLKLLKEKLYSIKLFY